MEMIKAGPIGERAVYDEPYDDEWEETADTEWDEKGCTRISLVYVSYNDYLITSIQFGYLNDGGDDGSLFLSTKFGPSEGHNFRVVRMNKDEYVTGLSGVLGMGKFGGIRNLTFHTNRGDHGPIGSLNDKHDQSGSKIEIIPGIQDRREFGGFFGSHSRDNLSSIGIYVTPTESSVTVVKRENI